MRGCPRLRVFTDFYGYLGEGDEDADEAREILRHRGGDATSLAACDRSPPRTSRRAREAIDPADYPFTPHRSGALHSGACGALRKGGPGGTRSRASNAPA